MTPIITEGEIDHARPTMISSVDTFGEIILATDGDGSGTTLMKDLLLRLGKSRCKCTSLGH